MLEKFRPRTIKSTIVLTMGLIATVSLTVIVTRVLDASMRQLPYVHDNVRRLLSNYGNDEAGQDANPVVSAMRAPQEMAVDSGNNERGERNPTITELLNREEHDSPIYDLLRSIERRRFLPNYYLYGGIDERRDRGYKESHVVFMHHPKCGGTTVKLMLQEIGSVKKIPVHLLSTAPQKKNIYGRFGQGNTGEGTTGGGGGISGGVVPSRRIFMGVFSFGVCDILQDRPCSYFAVIRDPVERVISSYLFCQEGEYNCAGTVEGSITDWAVAAGSKFFNHLLVSGESVRPLYKLSSGGRSRLDSSSTSTKEIRRAFLDYCLNNLENWFSFIGLTEEMEMSMKMMEDVYGLPVSAVKQTNKGKTKSKTDQAKLDNMREALRSNSTVMEALHEDIILYRKGRELFDIQVKQFLNSGNKRMVPTN